MGHWEIPQDPHAAKTYFVSGWDGEVEGPADASHRWSTSLVARLLLPNADGERLDLSLECIPFLNAPQLNSQSVWVFANGMHCAFERLESARPIQLVIPNAARSGATLGITLVLPDATRPSALHESADERQLGVALRFVSLDWDR